MIRESFYTFIRPANHLQEADMKYLQDFTLNETLVDLLLTFAM